MAVKVSLLALLVVLTSILGGCTDEPADEPEEEGEESPPVAPPPPEARSVAVTMDPCDGIEAFFEIDAATMRDHVPEDFDIPSNGGKTALIVGFFSCGDGGNLVQRSFVAVQVTPRHDSLRAEGIQNYFWEPEHLLAPSLFTDAYVNMSSNHTEGRSVRLTVAATEGEATAEAANWTHTLTTTHGALSGGSAVPFLPTFREYAAADGGYVYFEAGFGGDPTDVFGPGQASLETGEGTIARELLGATAPGAALVGQGIGFTDARVGFVPLPAA